MLGRGRQIEGNFINGEPHGYAERSSLDPTHSCYYKGEWKDGKYCGHGELKDCNGDIYIGEFKNCLKHGMGTIISSDQQKGYKGCWHKGKKHGFGKFFDHNKRITYEGDFVRNKYDGKGKLAE